MKIHIEISKLPLSLDQNSTDVGFYIEAGNYKIERLSLLALTRAELREKLIAVVDKLIVDPA